jgi:hypothetical protein
MGSTLFETSLHNGARRNQEGVPPPPSPERPPLAPHDPPEPAPQAAAWERALRVIFMETNHPHGSAPPKNRTWRANKRGRAAIKVAGVRTSSIKGAHRH